MTADRPATEPPPCNRCGASGPFPRSHKYIPPEGGAPLNEWECGSELDGHRCSRPVGHKGMHRKRSMLGPTQEALRAAYAAGQRAAPRRDLTATELAEALRQVSEIGGLENGFDLLGHPRTDAEREWAANTIAGGLYIILQQMGVDNDGNC